MTTMYMPKMNQHPRLKSRYGLLIDAFGSRLHAGELKLTMPDGSRRQLSGSEPGPHAVLIVNDERMFRRVLFGGSNGFAESYMAGECDTPDLAVFLRLAAINFDHWQESLQGSTLYRSAARLYHLLRPNTRRGARRNILQHYDLGNDFYAEWLDRGMAYSAARFPSFDISLEDAQAAKYAAIADAAEVERGSHVLEIGCGWGGFAEYVAKERGAHVTAITISDQQFDYTRERIQSAGLKDSVEVRRQDYRDVSGHFDRIVSIEMFEAVGERYWQAFFEKVRDLLSPEGRAALQVITIDEASFERYRRGTDFIQRYIFPGGMLPSPTAFRSALQSVGLRTVAEQGFASDYARTLSTWRNRFDEAWPRIRELGFDERFRRMWTYYFAYCEAGFSTGRIDVQRVALSHGR